MRFYVKALLSCKSCGPLVIRKRWVERVVKPMNDSKTDKTPKIEELEDLEKKKLKLDIKKLENELKQLEKAPSPEVFSKIIPIITTMLAVAGFIVGIWQFNRGQLQSAREIYSAEKIAAEQIRSTAEQSRRDLLDSKEQEYLQAFWQERLKLYQAATKAAGEIASSFSLDDARSSRDAFWSLYWGPLAILEDRAVLSAMVTYGAELRKAEKGEIMLKELQTEAYDLARACRNSLKDTWNPMDLDDIDDFSLNPFRPSKK